MGRTIYTKKKKKAILERSLTYKEERKAYKIENMHEGFIEDPRKLDHL